MGRPVTREITLKSGFYIEVRKNGENKGIMIRRETYDQMMMAYERYENTKMYNVKIVGEVRKGKPVNKD